MWQKRVRPVQLVRENHDVHVRAMFYARRTKSSLRRALRSFDRSGSGRPRAMLHSRQLLDKGRFNVRLLRTSFYTGFVLLCASALALAGCGRDGEDRTADGTEQGQSADDGPEETPPSSATDTGDGNAAGDPDASADDPRPTQLLNPIANLVRPQACVTSRAGGLRPARGASSVADAAEVDILVRAIRSGDLTAIFDASNPVRARSISSEGTLPIHAAIDSQLPLAVWDLARLGLSAQPGRRGRARLA